jgi:hypothetical protein
MTWAYVTTPPEQLMQEFSWAFMFCTSPLQFVGAYWFFYHQSPEWHQDMRKAIKEAVSEEGFV